MRAVPRSLPLLGPLLRIRALLGTSPILGVALGLVIASPAGAFPAPALAPADAAARFTAPSGVDWHRVEAMLDAGAFGPLVAELSARIDRLPSADRDRATVALARALRGLGRGAEALPRLAAVPAPSPWRPEADAWRARLLADAKRTSEAGAALADARAALPAEAGDRAAADVARSLDAAGAWSEGADLWLTLLRSPDAATATEAGYALGWDRLRLGDRLGALNALAEALDAHPEAGGRARARLAVADLEMSQGRPLEASAQLLALPPSEAPPDVADRANFLAGEGLCDLGKFDQAAERYARVSPRSSWGADATYGRAYALWRGGHPDEAAATFQALLSPGADPGERYRVPANYALGRIAADAGRAREAEVALRAAEAALAPAGADPWGDRVGYALVRLDVQQGRPDAAIADAERFLTRHPASPFTAPVRWLAAQAQTVLGHGAEAAVQLAALGTPPGAAFLHAQADGPTLLGLAFLRAGHPVEAAVALASAPTSDSEAAFWRAEALYAADRLPEAAAAYASYTSHSPAGAHAGEAWYGLGWCRLRSGGAAAEAFAAAIPVLPAGAVRDDARFELGVARMDAHAWTQALLAFRPLADGPDSARTPELAARARANAGRCLLRLGRFEEAAQLLEATLQPAGASPTATGSLAATGSAAVAPPGPLPADRQLAAWSDLALARYRLHRFDGTVDALRHALALPALAPDDRLDLRERLAVALSDAGQPEAARSAFEGLLADPDLTPERRDGVQADLTRAALDAGDLDRAEALIDQASASAWVPELRWRAAQARDAKGDHRRAADLVAELPAPTPAQSLFQAVALRAAQDPAGATKVLEALVASHPTSAVAPAAWFHLGELALQRGDTTRAAIAYRSAEKGLPRGSAEAARARYLLGAALLRARRYEDVLQALRPFPGGPDPRWPALAALEEGEALEHLQRFAPALARYRALAESSAPAAQRHEAAVRANWLVQHVPGLGARQHRGPSRRVP